MAVSSKMDIKTAMKNWNLGAEPAEPERAPEPAMRIEEEPKPVKKIHEDAEKEKKNRNPVTYKDQTVNQNGTIRVGFYLTPELDHRIELERYKTGKKKSQIVEGILREYFGMQPFSQ